MNTNQSQMNPSIMLLEAVRANNLVDAQFALQNGADVNSRYKDYTGWQRTIHLNSRYNDYTALFCSLEDAKMTRLLIGAGADVNARNNHGETPLMCCNFKPDVAQLLIDAGADVDARDDSGKTPLIHSLSVEVAKVLIGAGADINAQDRLGRYALACCKSIEMRAYLIGQGIDVNVRSNSGMSQLMINVRRDEPVEIVKLLISAGADINAQNHEGMSVLGQSQNIEMLKFLIDNGAEVVFEQLPEKFHLDAKKFVLQLCVRQIFQICVGLQSLDLSAFELLAIVDESNPNMAHLTMHQKWTAITSVKHFHDEN